jgi:hypothetical protein
MPCMQAMVRRGACALIDRDRGEARTELSRRRHRSPTYYTQHIVLAGVMADAAIVDAAIARRMSTGGIWGRLGLAEM